jgi:opacity protein-like surface antigen
MRHYALPVLVLALGFAAQAEGQDRRSSGGGFTLGAGLLGSSVSTNFDNVTQTESGRGLNLEIGWGFTPNITAYLGINGSAIESDIDYSLGQADLGVRYFFRGSDKQARPYLEGALAARTIRVDVTDGFDDVTIKANSPGVAFGGGVQVFFTPKFALDIGLNDTVGSFSDWTANGVSVPVADLDATSANFRLGVRFWPSNR